MIVPKLFLSLFLSTLPTDWIISIWLPLGSTKATPSSEGTSTPSDKHLALETIPLSDKNSFFNWISLSFLSFVVIKPEI